jgi:protocatechuate 3,4-dioxygenase beta subunit
MSSRIYIVLFVLMFIVTTPCISDAANLRGRIYGKNQFSRAPYPIGGVVADLYIQKSSGWQPVAKFRTGSDGMYYFREILPGDYVLQINRIQNYPITVVDEHNQDLLPIVIQY